MGQFALDLALRAKLLNRERDQMGFQEPDGYYVTFAQPVAAAQH